MAVVDELVTLIGYKLDERGAATLKAAKAEIVDMAKKVAALSVAVIAGKTAFQGWFSGVLENSMQLQRLSDDTNVSAQALQAWGYAVGRMGGDAKGALADLEQFQLAMHSVIPGQGNFALKFFIPEFNKNSGLEETLTLVSNLLQKIEQADPINGKLNAFRTGLAMGFHNKDNVRLLMKGSTGVAEMLGKYKELNGGIGTDKQVKQNAELWQSFFDLKTSVSGYARQISSKLTPYIKDAIDWTNEWIKKNRELNDQTLDRYVKTIKEAAKEVKGSLDLISDGYTNSRAGHDNFFDSVKKDYPFLYSAVSTVSKEFSTLWNTLKLGKQEFKDLGEDIGILVNFIETSFKKVASLLDKILLFREMWLSAFKTDDKNVKTKPNETNSEKDVDTRNLTMDYLRTILHIDSKIPQNVVVPGTTNNQQSATNNYQIDMRIDGSKHPVETGRAVSGALSSYLLNPVRSY